jgi:hypothetical protein
MLEDVNWVAVCQGVGRATHGGVKVHSNPFALKGFLRQKNLNCFVFRNSDIEFFAVRLSLTGSVEPIRILYQSYYGACI